MSHSPSAAFLNPCRSNVLFLKINKLCLVNMAMQLSSHSFPIERSDELVRFGTMYAFCACVDSLWWMGMMHVFVALSFDSSGNIICGPFIIVLKFCAQLISVSLMYVLVAPVSALSVTKASFRGGEISGGLYDSSCWSFLKKGSLFVVCQLCVDVLEYSGFSDVLLL